jgi:predicted Abi (CAAX) family protease
MAHPFAGRGDRLPRWVRWFRFGVSAIVSVIIAIGWLHLPSLSAQQSSYALASQAPFNQPGYYPLEQTLNPALYRPTGEWLGRLVLPTVDQLQASAQPSSQTSAQADWVWLELYHTPPSAQPLVGQVVRLTWQDLPQLQAYVKAVTTDVQFNEMALKAQQNGDVLPERLNGRRQVGPLQSLAGARPSDDVIVRLEGVRVTTNPAGQSVLQIAQAPLQVTGRYMGLVQILESDPAKAATADVCPGDPPCPSELYQVRHYNPASGDFTGPLETVRIPQQPLDRNGRFLSTPRQITKSPVGIAGWYLYGAQGRDGVFTVQALKPRSLVQLQPDQVILDEAVGLRYIRQQNWQDTPERKGTLQRVLLSPDATTPAAAQQVWQVGDHALVVHSFGGIGGPKGEGAPGGTVTGHFAFGVAQVVPDPFTQELQFDILYHQIYAHNPNAIVAGSLDWSAYAGDLQRGWLGSRPFSEVLIKLDVFTDLALGDRSLSLLHELLIQTEIIAARYRTGDGTGISSVTPSTSCVQDSSQALYIALQQVKQQVLSDPALLTWLADHPDDPETLQFQHLVFLGKTLDAVLTPYGVVRSDWQHNAEVVAGVAGGDRFTRGQTVMDALLSWRSMLPRRGHDEMAMIFLKHGAQLWFLRPNQVLGWDPTIEPIAPTLLLGQVPIVSTLLRRLTDAISMPLTPRKWLITLGTLLAYGAIALPLGWRSGFLRWQPVPGNGKQLLCSLAKLMVMPALVEEMVFRVVLLPHPLEGATLVSWLGWGGVSLVLFVLYHPFSARTYYPAGNPTFFEPVFWLLSGLLGIACMLVYGGTGSLWTAVGVHWVVVVVWLWVLGGHQRLAVTLLSRVKLP